MCQHDALCDSSLVAVQVKERQLTRLYYGTFNPEMTAYKALIPEWQALGLEVGCPSSCLTPELHIHYYVNDYVVRSSDCSLILQLLCR